MLFYFFIMQTFFILQKKMSQIYTRRDACSSVRMSFGEKMQDTLFVSRNIKEEEGKDMRHPEYKNDDNDIVLSEINKNIYKFHLLTFLLQDNAIIEKQKRIQDELSFLQEDTIFTRDYGIHMASGGLFREWENNIKILKRS